MKKRTKKLILLSLSSAEDTSTFSACMRSLKDDPEKRQKFMKAFKKAFDDAMEEGLEDHQNVALLQAKQELNAG